MTREDLIHRLETAPRYDYTIETSGAFVVTDMHIGGDDDHPRIRIKPEALPDLTWPVVRAQVARGRDVDHITRVTGYFSKTSGWNKGKEAELRDRDRSVL